MTEKAKKQWREDFPISWEQDHYVTRRELVKFLTLGSALLVGANGLIAVIGGTRRPVEGGRRWLVKASRVARGTSLLFRYPGPDDPCIMVRTTGGELVAYSQICTHLSCAIVHRPGEEDLFCPCHHGVFALSDGRPTAGPPTRGLPRIELSIEGDDVYAVGVKI